MSVFINSTQLNPSLLISCDIIKSSCLLLLHYISSIFNVKCFWVKKSLFFVFFASHLHHHHNHHQHRCRYHHLFSVFVTTFSLLYDSRVSRLWHYSSSFIVMYIFFLDLNKLVDPSICFVIILIFIKNRKNSFPIIGLFWIKVMKVGSYSRERIIEEKRRCERGGDIKLGWHFFEFISFQCRVISLFKVL